MTQDSPPQPSVTVIIPVYDDAARLRTCLEALQAQTYPAARFDVVVVDNGSPQDQSVALPDDPRFTLVSQPVPGSYAARNRGLEVATGEVLAFTDADCVPDPAWLEQAVAALTAPPRADLVGGAMELFYEGEGPSSAAELYEFRHGFTQGLVNNQPFAVTANMLTWRAVFDRVGPFDERFKSTGDADFGRRVAASGGELRYAPAAVVRHPARATTQELVARVRRITGGTIDVNLKAGAGRGRFLYLAARQGYLLARSLVAVLLLRKPPHGATAKARYLGLYVRLRTIQVRAYLDVARGGRVESPR